MDEELTKALHSATFATRELQDALKTADAVAALAKLRTLRAGASLAWSARRSISRASPFHGCGKRSDRCRCCPMNSRCRPNKRRWNCDAQRRSSRAAVGGRVERTVRRVVDKGDDVYEPKNVTLRVTKQGAVRVNAAHVHREAPGIACIYVDLHSKRCEPPMVGSGDNEPPVLYFTAGAHALHLDESKPRDSMTIVEFPEYTGWHVFACDGPARYTLGVVLVAQEASA